MNKTKIIIEKNNIDYTLYDCDALYPDFSITIDDKVSVLIKSTIISEEFIDEDEDDGTITQNGEYCNGIVIKKFDGFNVYTSLSNKIPGGAYSFYVKLDNGIEKWYSCNKVKLNE